jgi:hypothetical protein
MGKEVERRDPYDPRESAMDAGRELARVLGLTDTSEVAEPFDHSVFRQAMHRRLTKYQRNTRIGENEITETVTSFEEETETNWEEEHRS